MKKILLLSIGVLLGVAGFTQAIYTAADFGAIGDSLFYTKVVLDTSYGYNYAQAGVNQTWNFSALTPTTQFLQNYLNPKTAGYRADFLTSCQAGGGTVATCNTRFNALTNLAFNDLDTTSTGNLKFYNEIVMDELSTTTLETNILGFTTKISGVQVPFTATYTAPDVVRVFPIAYGNADSSVSAYEINLNNYGVNFIYHAHSKRVNHVDAWGAITTPFATYSSTVRERAVVYHFDTLVYNNTAVAIPPSYTFEYAWFSPAFAGPVFTASGNIVGGQEKFTTIEYLDTIHCLQPQAAEHHAPILPVIDPGAGSVNVTFTNLSQNANTYSWNFGDPNSGAANTSTATDPAHNYTDSGTYTITLVACNTICQPEKCDTETFKLVVDDSLELRAGFIAQPNVTCVGNTVTFQNNSTNATTYFWNFGDLTTSTVKDPTHVYTAAGTYTVILTASNGNISDTAKRIVTVQAQPNPVINISGPTTFCNGDSVILSASGGTTYQWSTGHVGSTLVVRTSGSYTVKAINSCGNSTSAPVNVTVNKPVDTLTVIGDTAFCSGDSVELLANTGSGLTYDWRRNGQIIAGATQSTYYAKTAGTYLVNVTQNGCRGASNTATVTVTATPNAAITVQSSTVICSGDSLKLTANAGANLVYQWQRNGISIQGATAAAYYAKLAGSYTALVTRGTCTATSNSIILTVNQTPAPVVTPANTAAFCAGDSAYLSTATGINYNFQWLLNGANITGATNEFYYAKAAGNYRVSVSANGCTGLSAAVVVSQNPLPVANAGLDQSFTACSFNTITLGGNPTDSGGTGALSVLWTPAAGLNDSTAANPTVSNLGTTTTYVVVVTDSKGCTAADSAKVTVTGGTLAVYITATGARSWCAGSNSSITLTAHPTGGGGAPYTFLWVPSTYLSVDNDSVTIANPNIAGNYNYTVVVTDHLGCQGSAIAPVSVYAVPVAAIIALDTTSPCAGDSVHLTAAAGTATGYQWWQNGTPVNGATGINYVTTTAGSYAVVVSNSTCADTSAPVSITVRPNPVAVATAAGSLQFCAGGSVNLAATAGNNYTYQWFEDGYGIAGAMSAVYTATDSGSFYAAVTLNGCTIQTDTLTDTISPNPNDSVTVGGLTTFCAGGNVTLLALPGNGYSYQWLNNGANINSATNADFVATSTGLYAVAVTLGSCTVTSTGVDVTVNTYPVATITAGSDTMFCQNDSVILTAAQGAGYIYQWQANGDTVDGALNSSLVVNQSGNYSVVVTANGCVTSSNNIGVDVIALPEPVISQTGDTMIASAASSYQWYNGTTLIQGATQQFYTTTASGVYSVVETDSGQCPQSSLPYNFNPNGIEAVDIISSLSVYPNPTHDAVNINIGLNTETNISIRLYDMIGNEIAEPVEDKATIGANNYSMSLSSLPQGIYLLRIYDGQTNNTRKIVKQ